MLSLVYCIASHRIPYFPSCSTSHHITYHRIVSLMHYITLHIIALLVSLLTVPPHCEVFSIDKAMEWASHIIDNTWFTLGAALFRQICGIPMGANPSPAFADLYLFAYEFIFMEQFLASPEGCQCFVLYWRYLSRYQDDVHAVDAPSLREAVYNTDHFYPDFPGFNPRLHGIYPSEYLRVDIEQEGTVGQSVHHQDLNIKLARATDSHGHVSHSLRCSLYSKQDSLLRKGVKFKFFPAASSSLSNQCKYGIVFSQSLRYSKRCSSKASFIVAVKSLLQKLVNKGYSKSLLLKFYRRFCNKFGRCSKIYSITCPSQLLIPISGWLKNLQTGVCG